MVSDKVDQTAHLLTRRSFSPCQAANCSQLAFTATAKTRCQQCLGGGGEPVLALLARLETRNSLVKVEMGPRQRYWDLSAATRVLCGSDQVSFANKPCFRRI